MSGTPSSGIGESKSWRCGAFTLSSQRLEGSTVVALAAVGVNVTTDAVTTVSALPNSSVAKATLPRLERRVMCVSPEGDDGRFPLLTHCAGVRRTGQSVSCVAPGVL